MVEGIQAYVRCLTCGQTLWTEVSAYEQRCGCECGGVSIHNDHHHEHVEGSVDHSLTDEEFKKILEQE